MWTQQICHVVVKKNLKIGHNQMGNLRKMHWNFPKTMNFYLTMIFVNFLIIYSPFLIEISKPLHGVWADHMFNDIYRVIISKELEIIIGFIVWLIYDHNCKKNS
jgi:hypothetical protein